MTNLLTNGNAHCTDTFYDEKKFDQCSRSDFGIICTDPYLDPDP
jgi:hypothetical protein